MQRWASAEEEGLNATFFFSAAILRGPWQPDREWRLGALLYNAGDYSIGGYMEV